MARTICGFTLGGGFYAHSLEVCKSVRGRDVNRPLCWDDEVGPLYLGSEKYIPAIPRELWGDSEEVGQSSGERADCHSERRSWEVAQELLGKFGEILSETPKRQY